MVLEHKNTTVYFRYFRFFDAFNYKTYNIVYMFEILHSHSNARLRARSAVMHMPTFILRSSKLERNPWFVVGFIFSIGETFLTHKHPHTHKHTYILTHTLTQIDTSL